MSKVSIKFNRDKLPKRLRMSECVKGRFYVHASALSSDVDNAYLYLALYDFAPPHFQNLSEGLKVRTIRLFNVGGGGFYQAKDTSPEWIEVRVKIEVALCL